MRKVSQGLGRDHPDLVHRWTAARTGAFPTPWLPAWGLHLNDDLAVSRADWEANLTNDQKNSAERPGLAETGAMAKSDLRKLPKVDKVLALPAVQGLLQVLPRRAVVEAIRAELDRLRSLLISEEPAQVQSADGDVSVDIERIRQAAHAAARSPLQAVLNATGVVLHTNLGRAPLADAALAQIAALGGGYLNLEYRVPDGLRGSRQEHVQEVLQQLVGGEAHLVVNNNAAAVLLMLAGLCAGGEVVVSRGELVEIGGSFRVPDVMRASGARLCEVGTTNRTHLRDYQAAIGPETRALLKVHRSNFALVGFTAEVDLTQLVPVAHAAGLPCLLDLGSGLLAHRLVPGLHAVATEISVESALRAGCDVVTYSCDKLMGGPQAGVLSGTHKAIGALRSQPLLRALRPDKLTLTALCATLQLYRDGRSDEIPTVAMLSTPLSTLQARAATLRSLCLGIAASRGSHESDLPELEIVPTRSAVGGGALPLIQPDSVALSPRCSARTARWVADALRQGTPPVVARIAGDRLLLDVRTLRHADLPDVAQALVLALAKGSESVAVSNARTPTLATVDATDEEAGDP